MRTILFLLLPFTSFAQAPATAFQHLRIPSSSRGTSMGDCGIASANENQQLWYNVAKGTFTHNFHQASVSYTPWMGAVSNDTRFISLNYLGSMQSSSTFGFAVNYLNQGTLTTRDNNGAAISTYSAREYSIGASYALQLNDQASLGVTMRFLGQNAFTDAPKNIYSLCGDVCYYQFVNLGGADQKLEWGAKISNIGPKIDYGVKTFLPANFGVGVAWSSISEEGSTFSVAMDINKLLVPSEGDKGILAGMFSSFSEPKQLQSLRFSGGLEYGYANSFFMRGGVSFENAARGNRTYVGLGVGYKGFVLDQSIGIDLHYLVPFGSVAAISPFQNSFGFTLGLSFGNFQ